MQKDQLITKNYTGISLVEIILSISIIGLVALGLAQSMAYSLQSAETLGNKAVAVNLSKEGIEATRSIRNEDFSLLSDGSYGVTKNGTKWELVPTSDTTGNYTRVINISTEDSNTKKITSTVSWPAKYSTSNSYTSDYILKNFTRLTPTKWQSPILVSSFDLPTQSDAVALELLNNNRLFIVDTNPSVSLYDINISDENNPLITSSIRIGVFPTDISTFNSQVYVTSDNNSTEVMRYTYSGPLTLAGSINQSGSANANSIAANSTNFFVVRNSGSGNTFLSYNTSNSLIGSLSLSGNALKIVLNGNYAYVGTNSSTSEVAIVNITNPTTPTIASVIDLPITGSTSSIAINGTKLYIGTSIGTLFIYDITNPISPSLISSLSIDTISLNAIAVNNADNLIYIATNNTTSEVKIINISDPNTPALYSTYDAPGEVNDLAYNSSLDRLYLATTSNTEELTILKSN